MTTGNGVTNELPGFGVSYENEHDTANAFMDLWKEQDAANGTPSEDKSDKGKSPPVENDDEDNEDVSNDETNEETEDDESPSEDDEGNGDDETETEDDNENDGDTKKKKYTDDDEVYTKVKVGDEEHEVSVKDLKRLYGQEATLTKKSQEVAQKTREAEANNAKALAALDIMVKRAAEAAKPYKEINWAALMKDPNISAEEVQALQATARAVMDNENFLTGQLDGLMQHITTQQNEAHKQSAAAAIKALSAEGSPHYVKGWNNKLYNDLRAFAVSQGFDQNQINQLTDPAAFKMLNMAMQFHKGSKKVVVTNKTNKSPKKIVKSSTVAAPPDKKSSQAVIRKDAVRKQAKAGGTMDATINAFEALLGGDK